MPYFSCLDYAQVHLRSDWRTGPLPIQYYLPRSDPKPYIWKIVHKERKRSAIFGHPQCNIHTYSLARSNVQLSMQPFHQPQNTMDKEIEGLTRITKKCGHKSSIDSETAFITTSLHEVIGCTDLAPLTLWRGQSYRLSRDQAEVTHQRPAQHSPGQKPPLPVGFALVAASPPLPVCWESEAALVTVACA